MPQSAKQLLQFYIDAGVDCALADTPQNRFSETKDEALQRKSKPRQLPVTALETKAAMPQKAGANSQANPPRVKQSPAKVPNEEIIANARKLAADAGSLDELHEALKSFTGCNLKNYAKSTVFADGNPQAKLMLIGEAPGRDEDIQGLPFVGRSGQLLDRMLACIDLDRGNVYIANVIPWRPPGNRTPTPVETELCRPFIQRQIELVNPEILVFVGASATRTLTGRTEGITRLRGHWLTYQCNDRGIPVMPIFHPSFLLRSPVQKQLAWQDLLTIKRKLDEVSATQ